MRLRQTRFSIMLLGIISLGVIVLVVGFLFLRHEQKATEALHRDYLEKKAEYDGNQEKMRNIDRDKAKLADLEERLRVLDQNLADYKYVPTYLRQIQVTAMRTGNTINSIQPGDCVPLDLQNSPFIGANGNKAAGNPTPAPAVPANGTAVAKTGSAYQVLNINLDIKGNYVSIVRLLDAFRHFPKMIYVKSIDFNPQVEQGKTVLTSRIQSYAIITPDQYKTDQQDAAGNGGK